MSAISKAKLLQLPPSFINEVEDISNAVVVRSNVKNLEDCGKWVTEFGKLTHTKWNARTSKPSAQRFSCS